jgi:hypothetical protein
MKLLNDDLLQSELTKRFMTVSLKIKLKKYRKL